MRGKQAPKRKIKPDRKYGSVLVSKFINYIMRRGKKTIAEKVVYGAFDLIDLQIKEGKVSDNFENALAVFDQAIKNISPQVEVRGKRVGGANYQVPFPVRGERKYALAFRWLIDSTTKKKGRSMAQKLADEFLAAINNEGDAVKKKNDIHRMADANRAFAHFAR
jgi:small subunit ribosomal protein S7